MNNVHACLSGAAPTVQFQQLFQIPDGVRYEIATESHPIWKKSQKIRGCGDSLNFHGNRSIEYIWDTLDQCFLDGGLQDDEYVYFSKSLYLGTSVHVFDFSSMVYDIVKSTFARKHLTLSDTVVIHVRLGDFRDYCNGKKHCYFSIKEMEPKIREMKQKLNMKNVVVMSNGNIPVDIISRNSWIMINDIYSEQRMESNLQVIVEMATGVLAKHFVGNSYSTLSSSIAALRKRYHSQTTTTSIGYLMGVTNTPTYAHVVESLRESSSWP